MKSFIWCLIVGVAMAALDPTEEAFVADLLAKMTTEEKIGQMIQAYDNVSPEDVTRLGLGSVMNGCGLGWSIPNKADWVPFIRKFQDAALKTRLGIPLVYGQDSVHGVSNVPGTTVFPHNIGLGAARNATLIREMGKIVAKEQAALGSGWTYAPCVAAVRDDRWGRTYESFSEDADIVAELVVPFLEGLQDKSVAKLRGMATVKHFIADGGTTFGTGTGSDHSLIDRGNAIYDEPTLRKLFLKPYQEAIRVGAATVMPSYGSVNGTRMHANKYLVTGLLKEELGFDGYVISDSDGIWTIENMTDYEKVCLAINIGVDMVMGNSYMAYHEHLTNCVKNGDVPMSRVDDAVTRILRIKKRFGLFENSFADDSLFDSIGCDAHREVARQLVQQSAVLLKNENNILPLSRDKKIFVAGRGANEMARQCGGWTISWSGAEGNVTQGTTFLEGIQNAVAGRGSVTYASDGNGAAGHDVAIVVLSEAPYAEMDGDSATLALPDEDITTLKNLYSANIPILAVIYSGRPVVIADLVDQWDGLIAAFLPGTEAGKGLPDLIFGDVPFTGKLSFTWPKTVDQQPLNYGDSKYDPLYPFGFGLTL